MMRRKVGMTVVRTREGEDQNKESMLEIPRSS
jgi:hypothetical protein